MKPRFFKPCSLILALVTMWAVAATTALAQQVVVESLSRNGRLLATNLVPGTVATVEWAPTVNGPWTNNWAGLDAKTVDSFGRVNVNVPMFYRVRGMPLTNIAADLTLIPGGTFAMGDTFGEGDGSERPVQTVSVSSFYMGRTEVTKAHWNEVYQWATNNGYQFSFAGQGMATNHPVHTVTWHDAVKWCNARSEREGRVPAYYTSAALTNVYRTGVTNVEKAFVRWNGGYRLPTEAEWEKAARGGVVGQRFGFGDLITHSYANYYSTSNQTYDVSTTRGFHPAYNNGTSPVGAFGANSYGLYDMVGNVWEWCWDYRGGIYSTSSVLVDPRGPDFDSGRRILRGGSYYNNAGSTRPYGADYCRSAFRGYFDPVSGGGDIGFRVVLAP
jgi:formylglycine-generating enzyme required for sulfatase activity